MPTAQTIPSAAQLLGRARDLIPKMRERAAKTEKARRILPETHEEFIAAGFYKVLQPRRYGGYGLDYGVNCEISMELARGCPSSGWVSSITTCHAWLVGMMEREAQERVWGDDDGQLIASCLVPVQHTAERVTGGYKVSGRWPFASGVNLCQWVLALLLLPAKSGPPERIFALLNLKDCSLEDTWFV
ncbi:MAG: acyl-CoA dehydrogenase family protein, partial [Burkholderiales bacterium]